MRPQATPCTSPCPPEADLERFLLGEPCAAPRELEGHLLSCARCLERAHRLGGDDALIEAMRGSPAVQPEPAVGPLVEALLRGLPAASPPAPGAAQGAGA